MPSGVRTALTNNKNIISLLNTTVKLNILLLYCITAKAAICMNTMRIGTAQDTASKILKPFYSLSLFSGRDFS